MAKWKNLSIVQTPDFSTSSPSIPRSTPVEMTKMEYFFGSLPFHRMTIHEEGLFLLPPFLLRSFFAFCFFLFRHTHRAYFLELLFPLHLFFNHQLLWPMNWTGFLERLIPKSRRTIRVVIASKEYFSSSSFLFYNLSFFTHDAFDPDLFFILFDVFAFGIIATADKFSKSTLSLHEV